MLPHLLHSPALLAAMAALLIVAWALGYFGSTFEGRWRRRFNDERRFYAQYRDETDRLNIEKTQRIAELEAQKNVLSQEVVRLRSEAAAAAEAIAAPIPAAASNAEAAPVAVHQAPVSAPAPAAELPITTDMVAADSEPLPHPTEPDSGPQTAEAMLPPAAAIALPVAAEIMSHPNILPHVETVATPEPSPTHDEEQLEALLPEPEATDHHPPEAHPVAADAGDGAAIVAEQDHAPATTEAEAEAEAVDDHEAVTIDSETAELTRIRGIDAKIAAGLASLGVRKIEDIEKLSAEDEKSIEIHLNLKPGQIATDQWRLQAALIGSGEDDHALPEAVMTHHD
ncbi:hypothetical protein [Sphingomonas sp. 28-63-12]|uniref:hypothetical protein n=1 Tax=Sphingomonas sp. 28-63-12 TaxID=1970434 RepID=UPI000BD5A697|nr:MAG: hypothetical protein B7Y47_03380 [Sphingomonas sp. 28-63-12]